MLFDYKTTRAAKHPKKFLSGFKRYLQVDGYSGYDALPDVTLVGCWAHARRKFAEAIKALPSDQRSSPSVSLEGLGYCNILFAIERELSDATPEERFKARLERSRPVLDDFLAWLKLQSPGVLPQSLLGQAIKYCANQWHKLEHSLLDGRLEIDNNKSERSIKPFVVGRKGWLFCSTPKAVGASVVVYNIVETAKENGLIPFEYLCYLSRNCLIWEMVTWMKCFPGLTLFPTIAAAVNAPNSCLLLPRLRPLALPCHGVHYLTLTYIPNTWLRIASRDM